jgi:phosphoribosyl 1,2-cyclic phosphodiesterase
VKLTIWGARGSIPVPGPDTLRYGGNTPCVTLEDGPAVLILDAGTGIRRLGEALAGRRYDGPIDILLSHPHVDHIHGLPFFAPIHDSVRRVEIYGPGGNELPLREVLLRQMTPPLWPAYYIETARRLSVTEITADEFRTDYFVVRTTVLRHPGRTLGYSISGHAGGPTVNYLTDNELGDWTGGPEWQARLVGFLRNSEVLIHDATWSDTEVPEKIGWGHSSTSQAVDLAIAAKVRRLVLFHHSPDRRDDEVDRLLAEARHRVAQHGATLSVDAAAEGLSLDV